MKDLSDLDVIDYFRIIWNRRWYVLVVFALVSISGTLYARMRPDTYRSEARIAVDTSLSSVSRSSLSVNDRIDLIREQLLSRSFLQRMIQQTGAYGFGENGFEIERALDSIRKNIIVQSSRGRTFTISYRSTDPQTAQNVTRQFSDELIRASKNSSEAKVRTADRFAEQKFSEAENKVREINEKIRNFKQQYAGKLPEQSVDNANALSAARAQLHSIDNSIQRAKDGKDSLDNQYDYDKQVKSQLELIRSSSTNSKPVITRESSPEERDLAQKMAQLSKYETSLAGALTKYTENHPDVMAYKREIGRLEQEIEEAREKVKLSTVVVVADEDDDAQPPLTMAVLQEERYEKNYTERRRQIDMEIEKLEKQRVETLKVIDELESRLKTAPTLAQDLEDLYREEARIKREYDTYSTQQLNASMAKAVETDSENEIYQVLDEANYPIYPETTRGRLMLIAIFGGLGLGVVAAFGRELIDSTIGSEEEAKKVFGLPVLGAIPAAPRKNKKSELRKMA